MNVIELNNVSKSFDNFKLDNISLALPEGCIMGLIGENGAGKSTTIKLILDILEKDSGEIKVFGKDNKQLDKNTVGIVSDNFGMPDELKIKEIEDVISNIFNKWNHDKFESLIHKLNIPTKTKFKEMSTGNKMKVALAIALSHNASLLILDEPTNGLDPIVRDEVIEMLFEYTRSANNSVLISSHIVSDLQKVCDYIGIIHEGKVLLCEEKDLLLDSFGVAHCNSDEEIQIDEKAIIRKRENSYNKEYLINRNLLSKDIQTNSLSLEDLFIFMVRGDR